MTEPTHPNSDLTFASCRGHKLFNDKAKESSTRLTLLSVIPLSVILPSVTLNSVMLGLLVFIGLGTSMSSMVAAQESNDSTELESNSIDPDVIDQSVVRTRIERSLALLEKTASVSRDERQCFMCHHQAVPTFALLDAQSMGFEVDASNIDSQIDHIRAHLDRGRSRYEEGRGQGGGVDTAGYALWTFDRADIAGDELSNLVTKYILQKQHEDGYWNCSSNRPPSEVSDVTTTYLAIRALTNHAAMESDEPIQDALLRAGRWLVASEPSETEDAVFRLLALSYLQSRLENHEDVSIQATLDDQLSHVLSQQNEDGGWSQTDELESDAYATGTVLFALIETNSIERTDSTFSRAINYLCDSQLEDGSWHVASRSDPFQTYFESGFPHGEDQFISVAATSWATMALMHAVASDDTETDDTLDENTVDEKDATSTRSPK